MGNHLAPLKQIKITDNVCLACGEPATNCAVDTLKIENWTMDKEGKLRYPDALFRISPWHPIRYGCEEHKQWGKIVNTQVVGDKNLYIEAQKHA